MPSEHRSDRYAAMAAVLLLVGVVSETLRLVLQAPWAGWAPWVSHSVSGLLAFIWLSAALAVWLRHKRRWLASAAWSLSLVAPFLMVVHGVLTRLGGASAGLLYIPGALLVGFCLKRTWDGREFRWLRRLTMSS